MPGTSPSRDGRLDASAADGSLVRGIRWTLVSMLLFAGLDAMTKTLAPVYAVPQILGIRFAVFLLLAVVLVGPRHVGSALRAGRSGFQILRTLLLLSEMGVFIWAVQRLPLGDVHAVSASTPLMVTALAVPFLREQVGIRRWTAVGVGFVGLLIVVRPGLGTNWDMLIPLGGSFLWAVYQIMARHVSRTDSANTTMLYTALVGFALTGVMAPFAWTAPDLQGWGMLIVLALLGAGGHGALIKALSVAPASAIQPFIYTLFVWAVLLGYVVFGDVPDGWTIAGALLIVASGVYVWHRERVRATS
jgi:drug/metabolite transporter (DMT)-like permease